MAVAVTGFFDGVHLGHRHIIETLLEESCKGGERSLIITFWPHPRFVLQSDARDLRLLSSQSDKIAALEALGVDKVEVLDFTQKFARLTTGEYLRFLADVYNVNTIVLGYDNRIGSDQLLPEQTETLARALGIKVVVAQKQGEISSSSIRRLLEQGDVSSAAAMLGYDYSLRGAVVGGKQLGRTIGYPTANLQLSDPLRLVPGRGVYLSRVKLGDETFWGMTNVGDIIETNIFDFDRDIYGLEIEVTFVRRLRAMKEFPSLEELSAQLVLDEQICRQMI